MAIDRNRTYREIANRGKYQRLYTYLCALTIREWRTTFCEIESIIGFQLPASARLHRPWWSNQTRGNGHSQALSWSAAGWETAEVDMEAETLLLRPKPTVAVRRLTFGEAWPVHSVGTWPEGLSLRRENIYEERI